VSSFAELPDAALVQRCQETLPYDARPFEALVKRHREQVFAIAYRVMGEAQEAEDQTQEVFIKVYRSIKRFRGEAAFSTWIYRIAVNTCLDALSKQQRRPQRVETDIAEAEEAQCPIRTAARAEPTPEQATLRRELIKCIHDTMMALQDKERLILTLRDVQGMEYRKIADVLNVRIGAVKMRIHRARLAFQQAFARMCREHPPTSLGS
jgi:RNA polymerase sigma-70 factor (ECF subfamily)